jgi:hypothetical protein
MATIPDAVPGLVFRYLYLRLWQWKKGIEVGKERPCCILIPLKPGDVLDGGDVVDEGSRQGRRRYVAEKDDVVILLIQSDPPGEDQIGLELTRADKQYVGLPADAPSYVIVSEANIDKWPNPDIRPIPGHPKSFAYGHPLPGPAMSRITRAFLTVCRMKKMRALVRTS